MSQVKKILASLCLSTMLLGASMDKANALPKTDPGINHKTIRKKLTAAYRKYFGLSIPYPAYVEGQHPVMGGRYWTSVAYIGPLRYRLYVLDDGTIHATVNEVRRPHGTFRVAVVVIDYGNTNIADLVTNLWVEVQKRINENYACYVEGSQPMVQFVNTNFLALASQIKNPRDKEEIKAFVESKGYSRDSFDTFVSLDLNAQITAGGFASYVDKFAYMGYFYEATNFADLSELSDYNEPKLLWIAKAIYDHECGHIFGWEHEWALVTGRSYEPDNCITDPVLYGWSDTDGDNIPEIIDPTPYGMTDFQ